MLGTILVIEDNPDNSKLVTWILEDEGYQVICSETAEDGLAQLELHPIDAVLMDISLPGMDGKQATQCIRANPKWSHLPVLALTAHAIKGEHEAIMAAGVTGLLTKPLDEDALIQQLDLLVAKTP